MDEQKKNKITRKAVQAGFALGTNAHLTGFVTGRIYNGPLKQFCVPGMNCYSCPGALGACPIGSMQAMLSARRPKAPFYVLGYLTLIGVFVGRFICGWLCLFGLLQELLYKIPTPKLTVPAKADRVLRKLKYVFLVLFVFLFPLILRDEMGVSFPYFCKWICPVGMLEGGIPLLILNEAMRGAAHFLYVWKMAILVLIVVLSVVIHRPFCKYICPLGAFYGLFHRVSFLKLRCDTSACIKCGRCAKTCKMQVDPSCHPDSAECIRCSECVKVCPTKALSFGMGGAFGKEKVRAGQMMKH